MRVLPSKESGPGFTLVELLVVISIISLLASLLLPALARAKRHTRVVVCLNNLRQMGISIETYLQDTHKYPRGLGGHEIAREFACGIPDWMRFQAMTNRPLFEYIPPYSQVWHCPDDKGEDFRPQGPFFGPTLHYAFGCSYQINAKAWIHTRFVPRGFLPGQQNGWVDYPTKYILVSEPPARPVLKPTFAPDLCHLRPINYPYNYLHWHFNTGPSIVFDISRDHQKAISPILFVDGHSAKHDFTKALRQEPKHPAEDTKDWVWYQPLIGTNGLPMLSGD